MKEKKTFLEELNIFEQICSTQKGKFNKNLVTIFTGFKEEKELFLILELMDGNLKDKRLKLDDLEKIIFDIVKGLKEIHSKGFVHFDIRLGNHN